MIRLAHPRLSETLEFEENRLTTLVVENQRFFRELLSDLFDQREGNPGDFVLSRECEMISVSRNIEILSQFIPFDVNKKPLLNKVCAALEKQATEDERFIQTQELLAAWENYLYDLSGNLPGELSFERITVGNIIKSSGVIFREDNGDILCALLGYMDMVRELEGEKLFVLVNMRNYFTTEELLPFVEDALAVKHLLLFFDAVSHEKIPQEHRLTIDRDLCEF